MDESKMGFDPTINHLPDEALAGGANQEQLSNDISLSQQAEQEKTPGQKYIEKYYHPHLELPEDMPDDVREIIEELSGSSFKKVAGVEQGGSQRQNEAFLKYLMIYDDLRNGVGGLATGEELWQDTAEYLSAVQNQNFQVDIKSLNSSPENMTRNLHHLLANLVQRVNGMEVNGMVVDYRLSTILKEDDAELVKDWAKTLIDNYSQVDAEYESLIERADNLGRENPGVMLDDIRSFLGVSMGLLKSSNPSEETAGEILKQAKIIEAKIGIPYWVFLRLTIRDTVNISKDALRNNKTFIGAIDMENNPKADSVRSNYKFRLRCIETFQLLFDMARVDLNGYQRTIFNSLPSDHHVMGYGHLLDYLKSNRGMTEKIHKSLIAKTQ